MSEREAHLKKVVATASRLVQEKADEIGLAFPAHRPSQNSLEYRLTYLLSQLGRLSTRRVVEVPQPERIIDENAESYQSSTPPSVSAREIAEGIAVEIDILALGFAQDFPALNTAKEMLRDLVRKALAPFMEQIREKDREIAKAWRTFEEQQKAAFEMGESTTRILAQRDKAVSALKGSMDRLQLFLDTFGDMGENYETQADLDDWCEALSEIEPKEAAE